MTFQEVRLTHCSSRGDSIKRIASSFLRLSRLLTMQCSAGAGIGLQRIARRVSIHVESGDRMSDESCCVRWGGGRSGTTARCSRKYCLTEAVSGEGLAGDSCGCGERLLLRHFGVGLGLEWWSEVWSGDEFD